MWIDILAAVMGFMTDRMDSKSTFPAEIERRLIHVVCKLIWAFAAMIFLMTGLVTVVIDLVLSSYGKSGQLSASPISFVGGAFIILSVLLLFMSSEKMIQPPPAGHKSENSEIESAISAFILDLVEERKMSRKAKST
jgi:hypothetical protein